MITRMLPTYLIFFSVGHSLNMMARNPFSAVGLGGWWWIVVASEGRQGSVLHQTRQNFFGILE